MVQQITFALICLLAFRFAYGKYKRLANNINLGKDEEISGDTDRRWRNVLLIAFGQKKMFKNLLPAVMHLFIYVAFLVTQVELIEIFVDGFTGSHRTFASSLGWFYTVVINSIEVLSLLAFGATVVFLARRNLLKIPRFQKIEMEGWPALDANIILLGEILLIIGIFTMNGADVVLQQLDPAHYPSSGPLLISGFMGPLVLDGVPMDWLVIIERAGWWLHFFVVLGFLMYLPVSKHLHIILAFPNTYFARLSSRGEMGNMPEIQMEVRSMLGLGDGGEEVPMTDDIPKFGASDVFDLSWRVLLGAYACTECGRCTAECPANLTGKKLSPRKVMMDIRDRTEEVADRIASGSKKYLSPEAPKGSALSAATFDDGKTLFDYITKEEIHACTTCNACVEACPVMINPLEPILELRRYEILTLSEGPSDWVPMFTSLENTGAVWQMGVDRDAWIHEQKD